MTQEITIVPKHDFNKQPGSFKLRRRILEVLANGTQDPKNLLALQDLIEEILKVGCEIQGGTWEEAMENLSAEEADTLLQQIIGVQQEEINFTVESPSI
jgi:hypothetical protein